MMDYSITKEQIIQYYITQNHSREECLEFFNITEYHFRQLIKIYNIKKDKELILKKTRETNIQRYGTPSPAGNDLVVKKMQATKLDRYGDRGYNNIEKIQNTNLQKYGVKNPMQCLTPEQKEQIQKKKKNTILKRYGNENYNLTDHYRERLSQRNHKMRETFLSKYGTEYYTQSNDFKNKISQRTLKTKQTNLKKYGVENISQAEDWSRKRGTTYSYKNHKCDSSWELAFEIYCEDHNIEIQRCPCKYEYYYNGEQHYYIPDYRIGDHIIELKGPHFFDNGRMICPFDRSQDDLYEAKHQCMIQNNVEILGFDDIKFAIDYVNDNYGIKFLKNCKIQVYDKQ